MSCHKEVVDEGWWLSLLLQEVAVGEGVERRTFQESTGAGRGCGAWREECREDEDDAGVHQP